MKKLAVVLLALAGIGCIVVGLRYATASQFMPYHAVVAGKAWTDIEPGLQAILLGMLRIMGSSFVACGIAMLAFAWAGWGGARWPAVPAALSGLAVGAPTLYVTLFLRTVNPRAETPVLLTAVLLLMIVAGALLLWVANSPGHPRAPAEAQVARAA